MHTARFQVVAIAIAIAVAWGCGGGGARPATPAKAAPAPAPAVTPAPPPIAEPAPEPAIDPTVAPAGMIAWITLEAPDALLGHFGEFLTTAGINTARQIEQSARTTGLALDRPIAVIVLSSGGRPAVVVAGSVGNEAALDGFGRAVGLDFTVHGTEVIGGAPEAVAIAGPHARWRRDHAPPGLQFEVAGAVVNAALAGVFKQDVDALARIAGEIVFEPAAATARVSVEGAAGSGLETFARSLTPSDFRLAASVATPGEVMFAAGTWDLAGSMTAFRGLLGPLADMWSSLGSVSDGGVAMSMQGAGAAHRMISVLGIKDEARARATYEEIFHKLATPVTNLHVETRGRARARKIAGAWFHEMTVSPTADATAAERQALKSMWGAESTSSLTGIAGGAAITAAGVDPERAITATGKRLKKKKPGPIADPAAAAAVEEATHEGESAVFTADLAQLTGALLAAQLGRSAPARPPAASTSAPLRFGLRGAGGALALRLVLPAEQIAGLRALVGAATVP